ncbi:MAG: hypothetical protein NC082_02540 [Clostridiales bacterium]|nr:hypothetical protein [Clostridiales bacterium]
MGNSVVWRLLRRNISIWQMVGYALANLLGLAIVLVAVQFYMDVESARSSHGVSDYLVVSKSIGLLDRNTIFSNEEIEELERQPWVEAVGRFEASRFKAMIGVDFQGHSLSTEAFFEAIPARFFDRLPRDWGFDPKVGEVPIILSRDYLSLYNFGFATGRGLPKLRDSEVSMIPLTITIAGNGKVDHLRGYVAGFSSRISTIAVPEEFMTWANDNFGIGVSKGPSRLVVEINDPGNPMVKQYLDSHGMEVAGDKSSNSEASFMMRLVIMIVGGVGAIITLLALFIVTLSIYLLLTKNRATVERLIMLGYHRGDIAMYYIRIVLTVNVIVSLLAIAAVAVARPSWTGAMHAMDMTTGSMMPGIVAALTVCVLVSVFNIVTIKRLCR